MSIKLTYELQKLLAEFESKKQELLIEYQNKEIPPEIILQLEKIDFAIRSLKEQLNFLKPTPRREDV